MRTLFRAVWLISFVLVAAQMVWGYSELPEQFASHFDLQGRPNGWSGKVQFFALWAIVMLIANLPPLVISPMLRKIPRRLINLPNKDYWFESPEREQYAISVMQTTLSAIVIPTNAILLMAFQGVWSHAKGGEFIFSLPLFGALLVLGVGGGLAYPLIALRIPKTESK
ncbi:DUF1648 domain-containing protein [Candidatus Sumerlaeota bacterium]|nr:DUF1648 domain-containing protein [Candidatus Sumerlaeota bacterium]